MEIGPGFGQYLIRAIQSCDFESYTACDLSKTSVETSNMYLDYMGVSDKCKVEEKDFFTYPDTEKFDCIVMGEVLEHVEQPLNMLKKINSIMNNEGVAFITTVINVPAVDHIYLFDSIESVLNMVKEAGFDIKDYICVAAGDIALEKAIKKNKAINIAMILKKH